MRIVTASSADAPLLARLHVQCFADGWNEAAFASLLQNDHSFALIAHADSGDTAAGFILIQSAADEAEILSLAVLQERRRHGLAGELVRAGGQAAHARNAQFIFLEVDVNNTAARALYNRLGFKEAGLRRGYYRSCDSLSDALILRAPLPLPAWESPVDFTSLRRQRSADT
jgi:ribosomal-protein-alanine N-acetyltransferase